MPVIAVVNRKGGSGKSTLATHLAAYCANNGILAMLGDVDRQQSTQTWLRLRAGQTLPRSAPILGWAVDPRNVEAFNALGVALARIGRHDEAVTALQRVGYERISGYLAEDLEAWERGGLPVAQAAVLLGVSVRQVFRLLRRFRADGAAGLASRRRGRPSASRGVSA